MAPGGAAGAQVGGGAAGGHEDPGEGDPQLDEARRRAGGPAVDRRKIQVVPPIKSTGRHSASVRLHADVVAPLEVNVVPAR